MNLDINYMAKIVKDAYPGKNLQDIIIDLQYTNNPQTTLNRIESGQFLKDTIRDSSKTFIILDSDEENDSAATPNPDPRMEEEGQEDKLIPTTEKSLSPCLILSSPSLPSNSQPDNNNKERNTLFSRTPTPEIHLYNEISSFVDTYSPQRQNNHMNAFSPKRRESYSNSNYDHDNSNNDDNNNNYNNYNDGSDSDGSLLSMGDLISQISTQCGNDEKKSKSKNKSSLKGKQRQDHSILLVDGNDDHGDDDRILLSLDRLKDWESDSSITNSQSKKSRKNQSKSDKESRTMQKSLAQQAKQQARLETKRLKELEKEQKRLEKEKEKKIQQVNRLKKDRFEAIKEMIVVIHDLAFHQSSHGQLLLAALADNNVQSKLIPQSTTTISPTLHHRITLKWQRKTKAIWDETKQQFIPFEDNQERIQDENAVLIFLQVEQFIEITQAKDMDTWIDEIKQSAGEEQQLFLMIEGLENFYKKKINWQRRKFANRVLENMNEDTSDNSNSTTNTDDNNNNNSGDGISDSQRSLSTIAAPRKRKRKNNNNSTKNNLIENGPSRTKLEETLTYLQIMKDVMLIISTDEEDSVDWMISLTADLARSMYYTVTTADYYKSQAPAKTGVEPKDIWAKMLQEIQLCTPAVADSVIQEYPTLMSLHKRYKRLSPTEGEYLLANLEVERSILSNRDRTINKFMSKKIHKIFTSDNPTDIIA